jgi:hypothetical protein
MNLDGAPAWTLLSPTGTPPVGRSRSAVVIDAANDRLLVAAGSGAGALADAWELPLGVALQWHALATTGPGPSGGVIGVEDGGAGRMIAVARGTVNTLVWELTQDATPTWHSLSPAGPPPASGDFQFAAA